MQIIYVYPILFTQILELVKPVITLKQFKGFAEILELIQYQIIFHKW